MTKLEKLLVCDKYFGTNTKLNVGSSIHSFFCTTYLKIFYYTIAYSIYKKSLGYIQIFRHNSKALRKSSN